MRLRPLLSVTTSSVRDEQDGSGLVSTILTVSVVRLVFEQVPGPMAFSQRRILSNNLGLPLASR
jgi:hypothetical protein